LGGTSSGGNFATTISIVSLRSLISIAQKKRRENEGQRGTNIDKNNFFVVGGF
jgi:hypothetical protein